MYNQNVNLFLRTHPFHIRCTVQCYLRDSAHVESNTGFSSTLYCNLSITQILVKEKKNSESNSAPRWPITVCLDLGGDSTDTLYNTVERSTGIKWRSPITCMATGKSFMASGGKKTSTAFFGKGLLPVGGVPTSIMCSLPPATPRTAKQNRVESCGRDTTHVVEHQRFLLSTFISALAQLPVSD